MTPGIYSATTTIDAILEVDRQLTKEIVPQKFRQNNVILVTKSANKFTKNWKEFDWDNFKVIFWLFSVNFGDLALFAEEFSKEQWVAAVVLSLPQFHLHSDLWKKPDILTEISDFFDYRL